jgi:transposase InsO family protein
MLKAPLVTLLSNALPGSEQIEAAALQTLSYPLPCRRIRSKLPRGGYFHIDIAEVQTAEGRLYLFVGIDRTSKFAFIRLVEKAGKMAAAQVLRELIAAVTYRLHTVLTDNGVQFTNRSRDTCAFEHIFDRVCRDHEIEYRLTKVKHPWTNGQVERMLLSVCK